MKIKISASLGFAARNEDTIVVDDDATDEEIQEEVYEHVVSEMLDIGWERA